MILGIWSCEVESYVLGPARGSAIKANVTIHLAKDVNHTTDTTAENYTTTVAPTSISTTFNPTAAENYTAQAATTTTVSTAVNGTSSGDQKIYA